MRILLIEDDVEYCVLLRRQLRGCLEIDEAHSVTSAIHKLKTQHYDAVLLDLTLPDSVKETTLDRVKQAKPTAVVMILSGYDDPDFIRESIAKSASGYFIKGRDDDHPDILMNAILLAVSSNNSCRGLERAGQILETCKISA